MHFIPGLRLRVDEDTEIVGIDDTEMGEYAYDYVGQEVELSTAPEIPYASKESTSST